MRQPRRLSYPSLRIAVCHGPQSRPTNSSHYYWKDFLRLVADNRWETDHIPWLLPRTGLDAVSALETLSRMKHLINRRTEEKRSYRVRKPRQLLHRKHHESHHFAQEGILASSCPICAIGPGLCESTFIVMSHSPAMWSVYAHCPIS